MKRYIFTLMLLASVCLSAMAINKELNITLDGKNRTAIEKLGFADIAFEYLYNVGRDARVRITIDNQTGNPPHAIILSKIEMDEKSLKKGKPKFEFEKSYPGKKGTRAMKGCRAGKRNLSIIPAGEIDTLATVQLPLGASTKFTIPLYEASYKEKDKHKKGKYGINYKILEERIYDITITVTAWTEDDPTYVAIKKEVTDFVESMKDVEFCHNKNHKPSLEGQQKPYRQRRDSLIDEIHTIMQPKVERTEWMSSDAPYKAYTALLSELHSVEFKTIDCGNHRPKPQAHKCSYCPLSAQDIYHQLDDLYQQLHAGNIKKDQALKTARGLYTCYQKNTRRKKDSSYDSKITRYYNSIANY